MNPKPAVFIDRDGTLIEEVGYVNRLDRLAFFPWTTDAVRVLNDAGLMVVVITNQAGVALGYFDEAFVRRTHEAIDSRLRAGLARIDGYYYCPHHPRATVDAYRVECSCRKPRPGMLHQAAADLGIDLPRSYVVGDRRDDIECGRAAGTKAVLVGSGYASPDDEGAAGVVTPDHVADNLMAAAAWILRSNRQPPEASRPIE